MKIAGMNITYRHFPFEHFLDHVTELGIEHIELWAGEPHLYVYRNVLGNLRHIRQQLKSRDMKVVCYTPEQCVYPFNIAASDSQLRQKSIVYFIDNLYAALELETNMMLVTSGIGDFAVSQLESWKYASDSIYQISRVAEKEGVTLALEPLTRFESNLIIDAKGIKRMLEEIRSPSLKGMIDTVAMQLANETPEDYFSLLAEMVHFHLIDGDGLSDAHLALDDGVLNWREYLTSLQSHHYEGACTLEIMGFNYYQNPQEVLRESVRKIRGMEVLSP
ncbi:MULTISPECIES: TIM barrel protein [Paenibacillus]|jgi:protein FrlC|uniref:TIM barrel protein n=1 Tax=Paenibacillus TaxID=44249 RepID=UPI000318267E|nr:MULTISPECIES: TIM barrel protein [Paenibacillus]MDP9678739.1 protein FrlC [Paenibacillus jamilae]KAF6582787.1 TIM barrel protein [Paenibacillus sp. EKM211P]KAF6615417.1 TIM barrel protein [Paenibacillus sp. EKM101P]KAF6619585.1 TIM barrel protein [Paenibacillus sp. EKM102P]KAF6627542.1 TIM barrel protein [Paenibacillus sp. EKM10P]